MLSLTISSSVFWSYGLPLNWRINLAGCPLRPQASHFLPSLALLGSMESSRSIGLDQRALVKFVFQDEELNFELAKPRASSSTFRKASL